MVKVPSFRSWTGRGQPAAYVPVEYRVYRVESATAGPETISVRITETASFTKAPDTDAIAKGIQSIGEYVP